MKKLEYIDDKNFETQIVEFENEHYDVAEQIYIQCKKLYDHVHPINEKKLKNEI